MPCIKITVINLSINLIIKNAYTVNGFCVNDVGIFYADIAYLYLVSQLVIFFEQQAFCLP